MEMCNCGPGGCVCQSCGMPMRSEEDHGTDAGGEKSCENCHYCMQDGKYLIDAQTPAEFIEKVKAKMTEMGMPAEEVEKSAAMMEPILPSLKRWK